MAWPTLSRSEVTVERLEQSTLELLDEFLAGWFDGQAHTFNGASVTFPSVVRSYQAGSIQQPLGGQSISVVWDKKGKVDRYLIDGKRMAYMRTSFTFYVRAAGTNTANGGPEVQIKRTTDLLYALLSNREATKHLTRKGITHVKPQQPTVITSTDYHMRSVIVSAKLVFEAEERA